MDKKEFIPCPHCTEGYIISERNGEKVARKCRCLQSYQDKTRVRLEAEKAGLPPFIADQPIEDYTISSYIGEKSKSNIEKIKIFINKFEKKFYKYSIYMYGPNGTQKSTLAHYVGRELIKKRKKVKYILMNNLIRLLTQEDFQEEVEQQKKQCETADCLIIDEAFDKEKVTLYKSRYQIPFLITFLKKRMEEYNKSIVFVSNQSISKIRSNDFGESIYDLLKRNITVFQLELEFRDHYSLKDDFKNLFLED
jgi:DNA replication protein DnaC